MSVYIGVMKKKDQGGIHHILKVGYLWQVGTLLSVFSCIAVYLE